jgi:amino acid transporter
MALRARLIAWCVLLSVVLVVVVGAYLVISSSLALFEQWTSSALQEVKEPSLTGLAWSTLGFVESFVWIVFALLLIALIISLGILYLEDLASRIGRRIEWSFTVPSVAENTKPSMDRKAASKLMISSIVPSARGRFEAVMP